MKTGIRLLNLLGKIFRENFWFFLVFSFITFIIIMLLRLQNKKTVFHLSYIIFILFSFFYKVLFFLFFFSSKNIFLGKKFNYFEKFLTLFLITFSVLFFFFIVVIFLSISVFKFSEWKSLTFSIFIVLLNLVNIIWFLRLLRYWCLFVPAIKNWEKISKVKFLSHELLIRWCFENLRSSLFNWKPVDNNCSESKDVSFWNIDEIGMNFFRFFDTRPVIVVEDMKLKNFNIFKIYSKLRKEVKK